jgi:hypothetical protein
MVRKRHFWRIHTCGWFKKDNFAGSTRVDGLKKTFLGDIHVKIGQNDALTSVSRAISGVVPKTCAFLQVLAGAYPKVCV